MDDPPVQTDTKTRIDALAFKRVVKPRFQMILNPKASYIRTAVECVNHGFALQCYLA